jgi:hypothetical protein
VMSIMLVQTSSMKSAECLEVSEFQCIEGIHIRGEDLGSQRLIIVLTTATHENVVVGSEVCFQPDNGTQIQMRSRLIKQQQMRLDEQCSCQSDSHSPTTRHILGRFSQHLLSESQTSQDRTSLGFESSGVHFLEFFVNGLESEIVDIVSGRHVLGEFFESGNFLLGGSDDVVESIDV